MTPDELASRLDRLFATELADFVKERDALAAALRAEGDKTRAAEVKKIARPSVSAWAVNQLYRRERAAFEALLEAGGGLEAAQREALAGGGGAALTAALATRRRRVAVLVAKAREVLEASNHAASAATLARVETTLDALATAPDGATLGRLVADVEHDGLEALVSLAPSMTSPAPPPRAPTPAAQTVLASPAPVAEATPDREAERHARRASLEAAEQRARLALHERQEQSRTRQAAAIEALDARAAAKASADQAAQTVDAAERALDRAKQDLDARRTEHRTAADRARSAEQARADSDGELERARLAHESTLRALRADER